MLRKSICWIVLVIGMSGAPLFSAELRNDYPITPIPFTRVHFQDHFWAPRIETNRRVTIPYAFQKCEETGRFDNFALAGGLQQGEHRGDFPFDDTDPYKILEGAAYTLSIHPDPKLESYLDSLIAKFAAAQEKDGYLYTCRTNRYERLRNGWFGPERWSKLSSSHELYNAGHMYEAAVAHFQATGKRSFLEVAVKNADCIDRVFGPGKLRLPPGHQIIEMGLARLFRATGNEKYLNLAKFFLEVRGHPYDSRSLYGPYSQDHKPVIDQDEAVGHAVRATYMYAGMADIAALTGDERYTRAIDRLWENVVSKKLYITGGVGARGRGEAFGDNYELPNMSAYCETCAAIGNVYWNHRLFLLHGEAKYIDVLERTLYNGLISGVSLDGKLFFYPNPLASRGQHARSPWFGCACCPGNITRFLASVPGYAYAQKDDVLYVNLFATGRAEFTINRHPIRLEQQTRYPWDGDVKIILHPQSETEFSLNIRIPGWAGEQPVPSDLYRYLKPSPSRITLRINNQPVTLNQKNGYARLQRKWRPGDTLSLHLPMPVRRILAHDNVEADRGRIALQCGPLVYCAEWPDSPTGHVRNLILPDDIPLQTEFRRNMIAGHDLQVITGQAVALKRNQTTDTLQKTEQLFLAIPYYAWAHRGKGEMRVWLPRDMKAATPLPADTIASSARLSTSYQTYVQNARLPAVNDRETPRNSTDESGTFFHWWPHRGTTEQLQYDFTKKETVTSVEVYWFDDTGRGNCRTPASWRLLYRRQGRWESVTNQTPYTSTLNTFNKVTFNPVTTDGLRLEVQLKPDFSAGVIEWTVN